MGLAREGEMASLATKMGAPEAIGLEVVAELRGVTKRYGKVVALAGLDLRFGKGQLTAVLGPNGAGKTTAIKLLLGLTRPNGGSVRVFGKDPVEPAARQRVGAMLQIAKVPETLKVREHVELFASYYPKPMGRRAAIQAAGLQGYEERLFGQLSGGERQRVLFALALVGNPELLFLDEPTVSLDVEARRGFWEQIRGLVERGKSIVLTTHYLEEADALADRVLVLDRGRVIADGTPADIKRLAAGKRVRCVTRLGEDVLRRLPGVQSLAQDRDAWLILTREPEQLVRELVARDPQLRDLEVAAAGLEEAFLKLTGRQS
jgi:ABC-2 type transport system ATP-binding protein